MQSDINIYNTFITIITIAVGIPESEELEDSEFVNWDPMTEQYNSNRNSTAVDIDDAGVALVQYSK